MIIFLILIAVSFFLIKKRLWLSTVWHDVAAIASFYRVNGNNALKYFQNIGSPLSDYIISITYGNSSKIGDMTFDLMLTISGICLYFTTCNIFNNPVVALVCVCVFYFCCLAPETFETGGAAPEMYANFFTILGLMLVSFGLKDHSIILIMIGCSLSFLGVFTKITAVEFMWPITYIFVANGFSRELVYGLSSMLMATAGLFVVSLLCNKKSKSEPENHMDVNKVNFTEKIRLFFQYQKYDLKIRYGEFTIKAIVKKNIKRILKHLSVIFPVVILFVVFLMGDDAMANDKLLLLIWLAISFTHCVMRFQFQPLYFLMAHYPMSIGAAFVVVQCSDFIRSHIVGSLLIFLIVAGMVIDSYRRNTIRPRFKRSFQNLKDNVIDVVHNDVKSHNYIFVDTGYPQIYYELGCNGPPSFFIWADRIRWYLEKETYQKEFIRYFSDKKPKFYLAIGHTFNLTYIEKLTGLKYELMKSGYGDFYILSGQDETYDPDQEIKFDVELLYQGDNGRYNNDRRNLLAKIAVLCNEGERLLQQEKPELALIKFEEAMRNVKGVPQLNLLRAKTLINLGFDKEAVVALENELKLQPNNQKVKTMLSHLVQKMNLDEGRKVNEYAL